MKKIVIAAGLSLSLSTIQVSAGGLALPIMEEEVTEAAAAGSQAGILVPILALALFGLAVSNRNSNSPKPGGGEEVIEKMLPQP